MANEPGAAVLAMFAQLIDSVKQRTPVGTNDKPIGQKVYSQLVLGMPIDRRDYMNPWSPAGGAALAAAAQPAPASGQPAPAAGQPPADSAPTSDPATQLAMQAAWKTALLCRTMLAVTKDGAYREYPTGRHLDIAYSSVLSGMTANDVPEESADIKKRRLDAQKVLYKTGADGNVILGENTPLYDKYLDNSDAVAEAKMNFAIASAQANADPILRQAWPVVGLKYNRAVERARDNLVSQGAQQVELALSTIASIGVPVETFMIKRAQDAWDTWNVALSGVVPGLTPYSLILPTNWCDPDNHDGWQTLTVQRSGYQHYDTSNFNSQSASSWLSHSQSSGGGGGVMLGFAAFGGSGGSSSANQSWQTATSTTFTSAFRNTATNLRIEMEYGMCTIVRPWLISDLFFVKNWYLAHGKKNSISDGTIDGQADSQDKLLPMIPQQFLVVRNVKISSSNWGEDGARLSQYYGSAQGSSQSQASHEEGSAGVCLGFLSFGGTASHSEQSASGQSSSAQAASGTGYYGTTFNGETLHIPGAQIVAFLSDIVPACPDTDDKNLPH